MMVCLFTIQSFYIVIRFVLQNYGKRHKKALGKAQKSVAEGDSLKLLSEFKCLLFDFTFESDVFSNFREHLRSNAEE